MDILKLAIDWAKSEVFSSPFFVLFGLIFIIASIGFWQLGKTDIAKAYIIPTLMAGMLLMIIGLGLLFNNITRISAFETAYNSDPSAFIKSEIKRGERTLNEYQTIVFKAIPLIIAVCALILMFSDTPNWRASAITMIAMLAVIFLIDGTAHARIEAYYEQLALVKNEMEVKGSQRKP
jgi:drug/metabolite transporter (DMT)-like permease